MQKAHPLICEARVMTSSFSKGSRPSFGIVFPSSIQGCMAAGFAVKGFSLSLILACAGLAGTCFMLSPRAEFLSLVLAGDRCNLLSMAISINRDDLIGALVSLVAGASAIGGFWLGQQRPPASFADKFRKVIAT